MIIVGTAKPVSHCYKQTKLHHLQKHHNASLYTHSLELIPLNFIEKR